MAVIQATHYGRRVDVLVDDEDVCRVQTRSWHVTEKGYVRGHNEYLHRFIMGGGAPEYDHRNGDKLDNRKVNLEPCTHAQNMMNKGLYSNNTSGAKGVTWVAKKGKWRAFINKYGQIRTIGFFESFEDAVIARKTAEAMR